MRKLSQFQVPLNLACLGSSLRNFCSPSLLCPWSQMRFLGVLPPSLYMKAPFPTYCLEQYPIRLQASLPFKIVVYIEPGWRLLQNNLKVQWWFYSSPCGVPLFWGAVSSLICKSCEIWAHSLFQLSHEIVAKVK